MKNTILDLRNLKTYFKLDEGILKAVDGVSFALNKEETLGIIGESGCGKSVTSHSILRTVLPPGKIISGEIYFHRDDEILDLAKQDPHGHVMRDIRGKDISMIFQEPMSSLSPVHTIGSQIMEPVLIHMTKNRLEAKEIAIEMLNKVGMSNPAQRFNEYPHQLSGGMCQRAMIAIALSCNPTILIADEPTTALDVTVQAQILELIKELQQQNGMSVLYITHDMGVVSQVADEVAVMYLGRIVEKSTVKEIFKNPIHPYTNRLLKSIPKLGKKAGIRLDAIAGNVPVPLNPPRECGFYSRCTEAKEGLCNKSVPALVEVQEGHYVRCFLHNGGEEEHDE